MKTYIIYLQTSPVPTGQEAMIEGKWEKVHNLRLMRIGKCNASSESNALSHANMIWPQYAGRLLVQAQGELGENQA
jgi:hypothetical protein